MARRAEANVAAEPAGRDRLAPLYGDLGRHTLKQIWQLSLPGEIDSRAFMVIRSPHAETNLAAEPSVCRTVLFQVNSSPFSLNHHSGARVHRALKQRTPF